MSAFRHLEGVAFKDYERVPMTLRDLRVGLQLGGSDQMGNILSGLDLLRRTSDSPVDCYGLCFPLLTNAEGVKMGKSVGGAIWLSSGKRKAAF